MAINFFGECVFCAGQFVAGVFGAVVCDHILLHHHMAECGQSEHTRRISGIQKYTRYNQQEPSQGHQNGVRSYHYVCIVVAATLLHFLYCKVSWWYFVRWTRSRWLVLLHMCVLQQQQHSVRLFVVINSDDLLSFPFSTVRDVIYFLVPIAQW